jgi:hypothetical protein
MYLAGLSKTFTDGWATLAMYLDLISFNLVFGLLDLVVTAGIAFTTLAGDLLTGVGDLECLPLTMTGFSALLVGW